MTGNGHLIDDSMAITILMITMTSLTMITTTVVPYVRRYPNNVEVPDGVPDGRVSTSSNTSATPSNMFCVSGSAKVLIILSLLLLVLVPVTDSVVAVVDGLSCIDSNFSYRLDTPFDEEGK